ncbi:hypothetical protein WMY93_003112 [Mugilogobius chulae]|uniref:Uncharacterized protein n=1 Tax=Mugilogobius chulae TaxID=88201 RepID=A0AAW0QAT5_9GOBI
MLTGNRKRARSGEDVENGHLLPQAKRQSSGHPVSPSQAEMRGIQSETSSSISSPEHLVAGSSSQCAVGPCSPLSSTETSDAGRPSSLVSYQHINRILREAHFQSLQCRGLHRDTNQHTHTFRQWPFTAKDMEDVEVGGDEWLVSVDWRGKREINDPLSILTVHYCSGLAEKKEQEEEPRQPHGTLHQQTTNAAPLTIAKVLVATYYVHTSQSLQDHSSVEHQIQAT